MKLRIGKNIGLCIRLMVFVALGMVSYSLGNANDGWEKAPLEVRAIPLKKLLNEGNFDAFINASVTMQSVINADPVLKGTFDAIQDPEFKELVNVNDRRKFANNIRDIFTRINILSSKYGEPAQSEIAKYLRLLVFKKVESLIVPQDLNNMLSYSNRIIQYVNENIPLADLPLYDRLIGPTDKFAFLAAIVGLAENHKIPTDLVLERLKAYIDDRTVPSEADEALYLANVLESLAKHGDMGEKTIQFFKEIEHSGNWHGVTIDRLILEPLRANPAYKSAD